VRSLTGVRRLLSLAVAVCCLAVPASALADDTITAQDVTVREGAGIAKITLTRTPASAGSASVAFSTQDGSALAGADYVAASGRTDFQAGAATAVILIKMVADQAAEPDESFTINLSSPRGAVLATDHITVTIQDGLVIPDVSVSDAQVREGPGAVARFTVSLSMPGRSSIVVAAGTRPGTAHTATDFKPVLQQLTFAPGETVKTVEVPIVDDPLREPTETFELALASYSFVRIADGTGVATVTDDDPVRCIVPKLVGTKVATVKSRLARAHCRLGSITRRHRKGVRNGVILSSPSKPGALLPAGAHVRLVVSGAPKKRAAHRH
jgi:hypothetical protein